MNKNFLLKSIWKRVLRNIKCCCAFDSEHKNQFFDTKFTKVKTKQFKAKF